MRIRAQNIVLLLPEVEMTGPGSAAAGRAQLSPVVVIFNRSDADKSLSVHRATVHDQARQAGLPTKLVMPARIGPGGCLRRRPSLCSSARGPVVEGNAPRDALQHDVRRVVIAGESVP
jgi:hypothetical protein